MICQIASNRAGKNFLDLTVFHDDIVCFRIEKHGQIFFFFRNIPKHLTEMVAPSVFIKIFGSHTEIFDRSGFPCISGSPVGTTANQSADRFAFTL